MEEEEIKPGRECLTKRALRGRFRFYGHEYRRAVVTRVTKARIFVKLGLQDEHEIEFNKDSLTERKAGGYSVHGYELVLDQALIDKAIAEQAANEARRALEARASQALADIRKLFDQEPLHRMAEEEIDLLVAFRDGIHVRLAAKNAGPG